MKRLLSRAKSLLFLIRAYATGKVPLYDGEFGYEIALNAPLAHYLHKKGRLKQTNGLPGTKNLYYFSPLHIETSGKRCACRHPGLNPYPHGKTMSQFMWAPPPFQEHYKNGTFLYEKPLWIIHNKFTQEWGGPPINYLNKDFIDRLLTLLKKTHTVVYLRPFSFEALMDQQERHDLNEIEMIRKKHPEVLIFQDIHKEHNKLSFNELQFMLHANAKGCISVQGGNSIVASYFTIPNFILAKRGSEVNTGAFDHFYPTLSNAKVRHTPAEDELYAWVEEHLRISTRGEAVVGCSHTATLSSTGRS